MSIQQNQHVQHNTARVQHDIKLTHRNVQHDSERIPQLVQHSTAHAQHYSKRMQQHALHNSTPIHRHVQHNNPEQLGPDAPACVAQQDPYVTTSNPFSDQCSLNWCMFAHMLPDFANQMFLSDLLSPQHITHLTSTQATFIKSFILDLLEDLIQDGQVVNDNICEQFKTKLLPSFEDPPPLSPHPIVKSNVTNPKSRQSEQCNSMVSGQTFGDTSLLSNKNYHFYKNATGLVERESKIRKSEISQDYCCLSGEDDISKGSLSRSLRIQNDNSRPGNKNDPNYPKIDGVDDEDMEVEQSIPSWIYGDEFSDGGSCLEDPYLERRSNRNELEVMKEKNPFNKQISAKLETEWNNFQNKADNRVGGNESSLRNGRSRSKKSQNLIKKKLDPQRGKTLFASTNQYRFTRRECATKQIEYFEGFEDNSDLDPDYEARKSQHKRWRNWKSKAKEKPNRVESLKLIGIKLPEVKEVEKKSMDQNRKTVSMPESSIKESKIHSNSTEMKSAHVVIKKLARTTRSRLAPASPEKPIRVNVLPNLNDTSCNPDVDTTDHPTCGIKDLEYLYSIIPNRAAQTRSTNQCVFCSLLFQTAPEIVEHITQDHEDLIFAFPKLKPPPAGDEFFLGCRHCNYLTFDPVLMWIHFQIGHGVPDILTCSEPLAELPPTDLEFLSMDNPVSSSLSYACCECGIVSTERDPMVNHRLLFHQDVNFNGRMLDVLTINTPDHLEGCTTYREVVQSEELAGCRQKIFVCAPCKDFTTACSYQALAHDILVHQSKILIYVCSECSHQSLTEAGMKMHLHEKKHRKRHYCTVTVVQQSGNTNEYTECTIQDR